MYIKKLDLCIFARISIMIQITCVNTMNNDIVKGLSFVIFKHYLLNILPSDYCCVFKTLPEI